MIFLSSSAPNSLIGLPSLAEFPETSSGTVLIWIQIAPVLPGRLLRIFAGLTSGQAFAESSPQPVSVYCVMFIRCMAPCSSGAWHRGGQNRARDRGGASSKARRSRRNGNLCLKTLPEQLNLEILNGSEKGSLLSPPVFHAADPTCRISGISPCSDFKPTEIR